MMHFALPKLPMNRFQPVPAKQATYAKELTVLIYTVPFGFGCGLIDLKNYSGQEDQKA